MNSHETGRNHSSILPARVEKPVWANNLAWLALMGVFVLLWVGCAAAGPEVSPTSSPAASPDTVATETYDDSMVPATPDPPASTPSPSNTAAPQSTAGPATVTITEGSVARYLVREQLARLDFPNDAIGETSQVSGAITFDASGQVIGESSRIVVDLESLTSDADRRDNFLRNNTLESQSFPTAEFVVRETPGLTWPLPAQGEADFQLTGDMTLHGVTRPLTWDATAQFDNGTMTAQAMTNFPFEEFDLEVPRVRILVSVDNNIRLELEITGSVK